MKKECSEQYRFHLRMWQATDPYRIDVTDEITADVQATPPVEFRALDKIANYFRRPLQRANAPAAPSNAKRTA